MPVAPTLETIVLLLLLASLIGAATEALGIPYTVGLVVAGIAVALLGLLPATALEPSVFLFVLLPPLLFEAAFTIHWGALQKVGIAVATLATLGVILSAALIAALLVAALRLPWASAIVFAVLVSATDPVAVVAFFRQARVPEELRALVEGESLLNDGTVFVVVTVLAAFLSTGQAAPVPIVGDVLKVFLGGLLLGAAIGGVASALLASIDDYLVETTLSVVVAYGSYLAGDGLGVSGVLATVAAGSVLGNFGRRRGMSPRTREAISDLWEFLAFVANSLVFLLLGIAVRPGVILQIAPEVVVALIATLAGRAGVVYVLGWFLDRLSEVPSLAWRHVLFWGGLRGALPVVVAYSLPESFDAAPNPRELVLGVVVVSLLLQGLTLKPVLGRAIGQPMVSSDPP